MTQTIKGIATGKVANIDKTAPKITKITAEASGNAPSVTVTLQAQDKESGITQIDWKYGKDGVGLTSATDSFGTSGDKMTGNLSSSFSHTFTDLEDGTNYTFQAVVHNAANDQQATSKTTNATTITKGITPTIDNIGDYVDYPIDINDNSTTTDDWRVFYVGQQEDGDASGRIFLIAADYVAHTCTELTTAINNSGMTKPPATDESWETYYWDVPPRYDCNDGRNSGPYSSKAQCSFPDLFMPANRYCDISHRYFCSDHTDNSNSQCASRLQCTEDWKTFAKGEYADHAIGGPTLNMWVESWNTRHGIEITLYANGQSSRDGYYVGSSPSGTPFSQDLSSYTNGYNDTLYFPHHDHENDLDHDGCPESCFGYWLASPGHYNSADLIRVGYGGVLDPCAYNGATSYGVRPVVCLKRTAKLRNSGSLTNRFVGLQNRHLTIGRIGMGPAAFLPHTLQERTGTFLSRNWRLDRWL